MLYTMEEVILLNLRLDSHIEIFFQNLLLFNTVISRSKNVTLVGAEYTNFFNLDHHGDNQGPRPIYFDFKTNFFLRSATCKGIHVTKQISGHSQFYILLRTVTIRIP
jgi:hypothetical protein